jgi:hypothetical protein
MLQYEQLLYVFVIHLPDIERILSEKNNNIHLNQSNEITCGPIAS